VWWVRGGGARGVWGHVCQGCAWALQGRGTKALRAECRRSRIGGKEATAIVSNPVAHCLYFGCLSVWV